MTIVKFHSLINITLISLWTYIILNPFLVEVTAYFFFYIQNGAYNAFVNTHRLFILVGISRVPTVAWSHTWKYIQREKNISSVTHLSLALDHLTLTTTSSKLKHVNLTGLRCCWILCRLCSKVIAFCQQWVTVTIGLNRYIILRTNYYINNDDSFHYTSQSDGESAIIIILENSAMDPFWRIVFSFQSCIICAFSLILLSDLLYKWHRMSKLKCFLSRLAAV